LLVYPLYLAIEMRNLYSHSVVSVYMNALRQNVEKGNLFEVLSLIVNKNLPSGKFVMQTNKLEYSFPFLLAPIYSFHIEI